MSPERMGAGRLAKGLAPRRRTRATPARRPLNPKDSLQQLPLGALDTGGQGDLHIALSCQGSGAGVSLGTEAGKPISPLIALTGSLREAAHCSFFSREVCGKLPKKRRKRQGRKGLPQIAVAARHTPFSCRSSTLNNVSRIREDFKGAEVGTGTLDSCEQLRTVDGLTRTRQRAERRGPRSVRKRPARPRSRRIVRAKSGSVRIKHRLQRVHATDGLFPKEHRGRDGRKSRKTTLPQRPRAESRSLSLHREVLNP